LIYWMKPLPPAEIDTGEYKPFIRNEDDTGDGSLYRGANIFTFFSDLP